MQVSMKVNYKCKVRLQYFREVGIILKKGAKKNSKKNRTATKTYKNIYI